MFVALALLSACQQDVLLALGDPTGVNLTPLSADEASVMSLDARPSPTALLIRPATAIAPDTTAPPAPLEGAPAPVTNAPDTPTIQAFNPISIPEDPPETSGVRFPGVTRRGAGIPMED